MVTESAGEAPARRVVRPGRAPDPGERLLQPLFGERPPVTIRGTAHELLAFAQGAIPEEQRQILILSFVEDMPQSEIATKLSIPLGTVKSRMRLAYGHLRRILETGL